jgi:hypothetical protein
MARSTRAAGLVVVVLAISALSCATAGTPRTIAPGDLSSLAGSWVGTITAPSARGGPGTLELAPSGDYVVRAAAFSAQGRARIEGGRLVLVPTATSGAAGAVTGPRSSVASLSERPDGALVLRGSGHSGTGPFDFEVVRRK